MISEDFEKETPVPENYLDELGELLTWIYGRKSDGTDVKPVVRKQNPDLNQLREVVSTPRALDALRSGYTLERSHEVSIGDERRFRESLTRAKDELQRAKGTVTTGYQGDKILFNTGSVVINDRGKELLAKIADSLRDNLNQKILVEGHTDNVGIGTELRQRFPTSWELSTARATAVARFLQEVTGLEPERLSACGYSFYRPLAPNDTEEGRRQNRRIEIILGPYKKK